MPIEQEVRTPATRLAYGPVVTKAFAKKMGINWLSATSPSLGGDEPQVHPSFFESLWMRSPEEEASEPEEEEEQEEKPDVKSRLVAMYQQLLDIFQLIVEK
jgi:hypothetical protein